MYTTYPLPPIDTVNSHVGLFLFVFVWIFGALLTAHCITSFFSKLKLGLVWFVCYIIPLPFVAYKSFTTGEITPHTNTKVTGQLVTFIAEGFKEEIGSGKTKQTLERHYIYAVYKIEGKFVPFQMTPGTAMPKEAIFYKN